MNAAEAALVQPLARRADRLLTVAVTADLLSAMAEGGFPGPLWAALEGAGVLRAGLPAEAGGLSLGLAPLLTLTRICAGHAAPLPVAETRLGQYALARAGMAPPLGPLSLGPATAEAPPDCGFDGRLLSGRLPALPWARHASAAVLVLETPEGPRTVLTGRPAIGTPGLNRAGEPRDEVLLAETPVLAAGNPGQGLTAEGLLRLGALFRAAAMVGVLDRVLALVQATLRLRRADGRRPSTEAPIAPVLAELAAEVAVAQAVLAAATAAAGHGAAGFEIGCARLRVSAAALRGATLASRLLGPASLAADHPLGPRIARLRAWAGEFGGDEFWEGRVAAMARHAAAGEGGLWPLLADGGRMAARGSTPGGNAL